MPRAELREGAFCASAVQPEHIEQIRNWRNAQLNVLRQIDPISEADQVAYFDREIWPNKSKLHPTNILLIYRCDDTVIGYGGLVHICWPVSRAEVSFLTDPESVVNSDSYRQAFETWLTLMKSLAFDNLNLRRLTAETYTTRPQNLQVLDDAGFEREGVHREHVVIDGVKHDSILHGLNNT